jgi:uracil-DNA glycosylase family 4
MRTTLPPRIELQKLQEKIVRCRRCPRLVAWREEVARTRVARFDAWDYWGKPIPSFGDRNARLLVVGLAPAAHGGNRTGRMFTGDRSGDWLYRTLHKFGFANQPTSVSNDDGLKLTDCYITAAARCAPPQNKLLPQELRNCRSYLVEELQLLRNIRVIVTLGKVGFDAVINSYRESGRTAMTKRPQFSHGAEYRLNDQQTLIASFHPSQQNTFTGKLTETRFDSVFRRARTIINSKVKSQK